MISKPSRPERVIAVDFGGVLVRPARPRILLEWERHLQVPKGGLTSTIFDHPASVRAIRGQISQRQMVDALAAGLGLPRRKTERLLSDFWRAHSPNETLLKRLNGLRDKCRVVVFSNMWPNWRWVMSTRFGLAGSFDHFYVSADLGFAKPDPRFLRFLMKRENVASSGDVLLIDDLGPNISAARKLGVSGIWFLDNSTTLRSVRKWMQGVRAPM